MGRQATGDALGTGNDQNGVIARDAAQDAGKHGVIDGARQHPLQQAVPGDVEVRFRRPSQTPTAAAGQDDRVKAMGTHGDILADAARRDKPHRGCVRRPGDIRKTLLT